MAQAISPRLGVSVVGFFATWWVGLIVGISFGMTGFGFKNHNIMLTVIYKAVGLLFCIALITGSAGYLYGKTVLIKREVNWWLPPDIVDKNSFIVVGSIHNFSYIGAILGLAAGIFYIMRQKKTERLSKPFS